MNATKSKKIIAYCVNDNGVDGREPTQILYATMTEEKRDELLAADKSKNYRSTSEQVIDKDKAIEEALAKLNGIDRMVLGLAPWPSKKP
jgi:hypothetical protein